MRRTGVVDAHRRVRHRRSLSSWSRSSSRSSHGWPAEVERLDRGRRRRATAGPVVVVVVVGDRGADVVVVALLRHARGRPRGRPGGRGTCTGRSSCAGEPWIASWARSSNAWSRSGCEPEVRDRDDLDRRVGLGVPRGGLADPLQEDAVEEEIGLDDDPVEAEPAADGQRLVDARRGQRPRRRRSPSRRRSTPRGTARPGRCWRWRRGRTSPGRRAAAGSRSAGTSGRPARASR